MSFEVHRILACTPDAYAQIKDPPLNERTGRRQWSGDAAKRAAGWSTATPVTVQEKVETIHELAADETVAALAACDLQRPEMAFRAMWDRRARERVNQAQFDQDEFVDEGEEDLWDDPEPGEIEEREEPVDPARIVRGFHRTMEFTHLIGVCQGFVAGASRLVPKLRGRDFTESQLALVAKQVEKEAHITWTFITRMARRLTRPPRPPRTPPRPGEPVKAASRPKPLRIRIQPQSVRLAPTALR